MAINLDYAVLWSPSIYAVLLYGYWFRFRVWSPSINSKLMIH